MISFIKFINNIIDLYILVIVVRVVLSWVPHNPRNSLIRFINRITDPPLDWVRSFVPSFGGLDFSPMVVILALYFLKRILWAILL